MSLPSKPTITLRNIGTYPSLLSAHVETFARQAPARGEELDSLLRPFLAYHTPIEALSKDIQHRVVFGEHLGHEVRDPTLLGDHRQALDQDRAETAIMEVIGDLDGDFRPRLVELDIGGMPDEQAQLVMGDQSTMVRVRGGRPVRSDADVRGAAEEPQAPGLQAQSLEE